MQKLILALLVAFCGIPISTQQKYLASSIYDTQLCNVNRDVTHDYRSSTYDFNILLFKSIAMRSNFNFVFSPTSIWIMLAAMAEGANHLNQQKLFQLLGLPNDPCIRQAYYQLATTRVFSTNDVNIKSTCVLLIDEGATLSPSWYEFVGKNALLDVVKAPIRYNPVATANEIKRIMSTRIPRLDLSGNSVLLDTMDYNGLWTTAFADAIIERAPFFNQEGEVIGAVDIMRVKKRARMGYHKKLHAKILELPVGLDERYRMLFTVIIENGNIQPAVAAVDKDAVFELIESLQHSYVQVDVAIPRMVITSEVDVKIILSEDLGVSDLWTNPAVTRYISNPPVLPTSFVQRSTLVLNNTGLKLAPQEQDYPYSTRTGLEPILGRDFIANRPFLFGLFDAETYTCLMAAAYTKPTYTHVPVEVAIPRIVITSEIDVTALIEDLGVTTLWNDPAATRNVSHPPALPNSYIHRAILTLDNRGLYSSPLEQTAPSRAPTSLDPKLGTDLIANRPFIYGLFDAETLTCLMASAFSVPTKIDEQD